MTSTQPTRRSYPFPARSGPAASSRSVSSGLSQSTSTPAAGPRRSIATASPAPTPPATRLQLSSLRPPVSGKPASCRPRNVSLTPSASTSAPVNRSLTRGSLASLTPRASDRSKTITTPATTPSPQTAISETHALPVEVQAEELESDDLDLDEEMEEALACVMKAHTSKLSDMRRVMSASGYGSSMSLHLLQAELKGAKDELWESGQELGRLRAENRGLRNQLLEGQARSRVHLSGISGPPSLGNNFVAALRAGEEDEIKNTFRSMPSAVRLRVLHMLLDASLPGDLARLIEFLAKIERTKCDVIGALPETLAVQCLMRMDLKTILTCRLVSKTWNRVISECGTELWRQLCYSLTSLDDERPSPQTDDAFGWFELYKGLYYREENWRRGLAQRVVVLKGHSGSIGAIKLRGSTLVTGSLDGTLRIWNARASACLKVVKMPAPVSSVDFHGQYGPTGVVAAGGNDVGRVFLISMNGTLLSTLSGHNKGIRTLGMNSRYLVSGGYDKALVVWNWREGTRIVKFGQQTNPCAAISLFGSLFSSVQVDGVIRCFDIEARELLSQHKVQGGGSASNEMFQWFVAEARRVMIATKTKIYELEYRLSPIDNSVDLGSPPKLVSVTPIVHELNSGTLDVLKRRFAAAPRFATRLGENMRIFIGHLPASSEEKPMEEEEEGPRADCLQPIEGAWLDGSYCVSTRNPTCMSLSSDQLVVGCSDGVLYALDFCGRTYSGPEEPEIQS